MKPLDLASQKTIYRKKLASIKKAQKRLAKMQRHSKNWKKMLNRLFHRHQSMGDLRRLLLKEIQKDTSGQFDRLAADHQFHDAKCGVCGYQDIGNTQISDVFSCGHCGQNTGLDASARINIENRMLDIFCKQ